MRSLVAVVLLLKLFSLHSSFGLLSLQTIPAMESTMDLRLIQDFSGDGSLNAIEWLEKAELVCNLRGITSMETVLPLRLTGGAFAVYQQMTEDDKRDSSKIKLAL